MKKSELEFLLTINSIKKDGVTRARLPSREWAILELEKKQILHSYYKQFKNKC
jgi:hypothetical protein